MQVSMLFLPAGSQVPAIGDEVEYSGCVHAAGDPNTGNDCDSHLTTAVAKPPKKKKK